jgi:ankyrin repeat protein
MPIEEDDANHSEQLHLAARDGDLQRVQQLLGEGYEINAFDDLGKTALHYAVECERFDVAQYLIRRGADVNAHDEGRIGNTPLGEVAGNCSLRIAKLLIDAGADPAVPGWMQLTALDKAVKRRRGDGPSVYALLIRAAATRKP